MYALLIVLNVNVRVGVVVVAVPTGTDTVFNEYVMLEPLPEPLLKRKKN